MIPVLIAGAGIGGLAAALGCGRRGASVRLLEQTAVLGEVGAGVQLGPNVTRILHQWGVQKTLEAVACFPERLEVRSAVHGGLLGTLPLGERSLQRYGAPYATIARADLHRVLLHAVQAQGATELRLSAQIIDVQDQGELVVAHTAAGETVDTPCLIGADGVRSRVRAAVLRDGLPGATGHIAFRAMVEQQTLPQALRSQVVTAWLGPKFHVVQYPVRSGEWLNVVAIVHGDALAPLEDWSQRAATLEVRSRLSGAVPALHDMLQMIDTWFAWTLFDRPPMRNAAEHAVGRVALLGDAAHAMRPYLAQGAGMAIEDAAQVAESLHLCAVSGPRDVPVALRHYADQRWQRNARVQARAVRNGNIFHATGLMRLGRDMGMRLLGERLLDLPWLYGRGAPN